MADIPPEGLGVRALLRSAGVTAFEPRVIHQLLDFQYRYLTEVLQDAQALTEHATNGDVGPRPEVSLQDVVLAQELSSRHSFVQPPSQAVMASVAQQVNALPLHEPGQRVGLRLPPEADCLLAHNYQLVPRTPAPDAEPAAPTRLPAVEPPVTAPTQARTLEVVVPRDWVPPPEPHAIAIFAAPAPPADAPAGLRAATMPDDLDTLMEDF